MRERLVVSGLALVALIAVGSCSDDVGPTEVEAFTAQMTGTNVLPPTGPITTPASGTATLSLVGGALVYRIDVSSITNVTLAHIHGPASAAQAGGVIVNLCGTGAPAPGCVSGTGVLAAGIATQVNGMSFDSLLVLLRNGNAYVNVHTNDGVAPTNSGPGDFPGGEIRGQVTRQ